MLRTNKVGFNFKKSHPIIIIIDDKNEEDSVLIAQSIKINN